MANLQSSDTTTVPTNVDKQAVRHTLSITQEATPHNARSLRSLYQRQLMQSYQSHDRLSTSKDFCWKCCYCAVGPGGNELYKH